MASKRGPYVPHYTVRPATDDELLDIVAALLPPHVPGLTEAQRAAARLQRARLRRAIQSRDTLEAQRQRDRKGGRPSPYRERFVVLCMHVERAVERGKSSAEIADLIVHAPTGRKRSASSLWTAPTDRAGAPLTPAKVRAIVGHGLKGKASAASKAKAIVRALEGNAGRPVSAKTASSYMQVKTSPQMTGG